MSRKREKLNADLVALATMSPAQLKAVWPSHFETPAPSVVSGVLRRLLAHRVQERRLGGLPTKILRELKRCAAEGQATAPSPPLEVTPGTRFLREWNGRTIAVEALEEGFIWEGLKYGSLSEIAREVTGAHWSGPRFFGLTRRG